MITDRIGLHSVLLSLLIIMIMIMIILLCREQYHLALNGLKDGKVIKMTYKMYMYWAQNKPCPFHK